MKTLQKWGRFLFTYRYQLVLLLMVAVGFGRWFGPGVISAGDWFYINPERVNEYAFWPQLLEESYGITSYLGLTLHSTPLRFVIGLVYLLTKLDFSSLSIIFYFGFSLLVTLTGMWCLAKHLWQSRLAAFLAATLYLFNSYALIIFTGGQMLGAVGYGLIPWIILAQDRLMAKPKLSRVIVLTLIIQLQILYDPRFFILTVPIMLVWLLARWPITRPSSKQFIKSLLLTIGLFLLQNLYWLYGMFGVKSSAGGITLAGYDNVGWVYSLSYSTLQHALFLHHLWWPTVVTGTRYDPNMLYGLILIFILFSLFVKKERRLVLSLIVLATVGIFLAKGINAPYGITYAYLFDHLPGFKVFRDPAKFFTLIAFCYSLLFALGWQRAFKYISRRHWQLAVSVSIAFFTAIFIFGHLDLWQQRIDGTFIKQQRFTAVSQVLREQIADDATESRILWVPRLYRNTLFTNQLSTLDANTLQYNNWKNFPLMRRGVEELASNKLLPFLLDSDNVSLVAIPGDPANEIYQYTNKSQAQYLNDWRNTKLFSSERTITDEAGTVTTIFEYQNSPGPVYGSAGLIITESTNIDGFVDLIKPDVRQNAVVMINMVQENYSNYVDKASLILLAPKHDLSKISQGVVSWPLTVPKDGDYRLYLPKPDGNLAYRLDQNQLTVSDTKQFGTKTYNQYDVSQLTTGEHVLSIDLTTADESASVVPDLGKNSKSWFSCVGRLESDRALFDRVTGITDKYGIRACLQRTLPDSESQGLFIAHFKGKVTGSGVSLTGEYEPRYGDQVPLTQADVFTVYRTDRQYDRFRISLKVEGDSGFSNALVQQLPLFHLSDDYQYLTNVVLQSSNYNDNAVSFKVGNYQRHNEARRTFSVSENNSGGVVNYSAVFDSNWRLQHLGTGKIIADHFDSNFGLNGWWVPAGLNGDFALVYVPANQIYFFSALSLISILGSLAYLARSWWRDLKATKG
ncbi:MAG: hypothetical protein Q7S64_03090 [bacterium]|nr:hypothetical protein [bacterium]